MSNEFIPEQLNRVLCGFVLFTLFGFVVTFFQVS